MTMLPHKTHSQMHTYNTHTKTMDLERQWVKDLVSYDICWMISNQKSFTKKVLFDGRKILSAICGQNFSSAIQVPKFSLLVQSMTHSPCVHLLSVFLRHLFPKKYKI